MEKGEEFHVLGLVYEGLIKKAHQQSQLPGEHTGGTASSRSTSLRAYRLSYPFQINSLERIQHEAPPPRSTSGATPSKDQLPGSIQVEPPLPRFQMNPLGSIQDKPPPSRSISCRAYRWSHSLSDQLPVEHTGQATPFHINSLGGIQVEPPPSRSTP